MEQYQDSSFDRYFLRKGNKSQWSIAMPNFEGV